MFYIYILKLSNNQLYTGFTGNIKQRLLQHKNGGVKSTKLRRPLRLIFYESYLLETDARRREKYLKTTEGKRILKMQLKDVLNI